MKTAICGICRAQTSELEIHLAAPRQLDMFNQSPRGGARPPGLCMVCAERAELGALARTVRAMADTGELEWLQPTILAKHLENALVRLAELESGREKLEELTRMAEVRHA